MEPWTVLKKGLALPAACHNVNEPCSRLDIDGLAGSLGPLPESLRQLLSAFDGAELFIDAIPLVTFFGSGVSRPHSIPDLRTNTTTWRSSRSSSSEWVFGAMSYGGYLVIDTIGTIREWDSAQHAWFGESFSSDQLVQRLLAEGPSYLAS